MATTRDPSPVIAVVIAMAVVCVGGFAGWATAASLGLKLGKARTETLSAETTASLATAASKDLNRLLMESDQRFEALVADRDREIESIYEAIRIAAENGDSPGSIADLAVDGIVGLLSREAPDHDDSDYSPDPEPPADDIDTSPG